MATIKSFTDLQQSKKLAEILPTESADMKWFFWKEEIDAPKLPSFGYSKTAAESYKDTEAIYLPCWSLATLLEHLRKHNLFPEIKDADDYILMDITFYDEDEVVGKVINPVHFIRAEGKNILDACYEFILKLKENNLI